MPKPATTGTAKNGWINSRKFLKIKKERNRNLRGEEIQKAKTTENADKIRISTSNVHN